MITNLLKNVMGVNATKMVIIIRTDIQMGRGKIASQAAHAATLLYQSSMKNGNSLLQPWLKYGQPKVILKVDKDCDSILLNVYQKALENNLNVCKVQDAGRTQIAPGTLTAIGIGPNKVEEVDKITSGFKLL